jgi:hypothetical protein
MLVRNYTSYNDLEAKKQLQKQLLEVEANNELENQRRIADFKNPYKPAVVPPKYKTNAEMARDRLEQEKMAINNIEELGFDYSKSAEIVAWLGDIDRLVKFNANFKGIRKELSETTNPRLLNSEFLKNYLDRYFEDLDVNYGHKFSRNDVAGRPVPQSLDEIQLILPDIDRLNALRERLRVIMRRPDVEGDFADEIDVDIIVPLTQIIGAMPSPSLLAYLKSTLTQQERSILSRNLASVARSIHLISNSQLEELLEDLNNINVDSLDELEVFVKKAKRALGFATSTNLDKIWRLLEKYAEELQSRGNVPVAEQLQQNINLEVEELQDAEEPPNPPAYLPPTVAKSRSRGLDNPRSKASKEANLTEFFNEIDSQSANDRERRGYLNQAVEEVLRIRPDLDDVGALGMRRNAQGVFYSIQGMESFLSNYYNSEITSKKSYNPVERPKIRITYPDGSKSTRGLGLPKKIIKHLAEDNREMKSLAKAFKKHKKVEMEVDSGSSSDSDTEKKGKGFKHSRIKVGGGVKVKEQPTYAHFGKYIIHLPHLTDKNVFNVKYPSRGSIPSIKPLTISDDYKDFVLDILDNGKMNERILKKLPNHEIEHFEKVVIGAGLTEVLKLKRGNTDGEKKDLDRYYLLRGEIDAGNNADSVIKELRGLIVKFMNNGRVHKSEGLNLLMELSVM